MFFNKQKIVNIQNEDKKEKNIIVKNIEKVGEIYKISDGENSILIDNISKNLLLYPTHANYTAILIPRDQQIYEKLRDRQGSIYALTRTGDRKYHKPKERAGNISAFGGVDFYKTQQVAIKHFNPSGNDDLNRDLVLEVAIYKFLEHNCVPEFYGYDTNTDSSIQMELGNKTFYDYIKDRSEEKLQEKPSEKLGRIKPYIKKLLLCLRQIHNFGIIHQDIKPENIVLYENEKNVKFIDWGLCAIDNSKNQNTFKSLPGTKGYISPEIFSLAFNEGKGGSYNYKKDIFALGIVFLQLYLNEQKSIIDVQRGNSDSSNHVVKLVEKLIGYNYIVNNGLNINNKPDFIYKLIKKDDTAQVIKENLLINLNEEKLEDREKEINENFFEMISHMLDINPDKRWNSEQLLIKLFGNEILLNNPLKSVSYNNIYKTIKDTTGNNIDFYWEKQIKNSYNSIRKKILQNFANIVKTINKNFLSGNNFEIKYTIEAFCLAIELLDLGYIISYYKNEPQMDENYVNAFLFAVILISSKIHPYYMECINISFITKNISVFRLFRHDQEDEKVFLMNIVKFERSMFGKFDGNVLKYTFYSYITKQDDINGKILGTTQGRLRCASNYRINTEKIVDCLLNKYYLKK